MSLAAPPLAVCGLAIVPPAIDVGPLLPSILFVGLPARLSTLLFGRLTVALPIVERAFAAPVLAVVFAVAIIRLKKPLLLAAWGELSPPSTPASSIESLAQSGSGDVINWFREAWLS